LGYPATEAGFPRSSVTFNESGVLAAFGSSSTEIRAWYSDENALTLGVGTVVQKNKTAPTTVTTTTNLVLMSGDPSSASGTPLAIGLPYASGAIDGVGRPLFPAMFITDITASSTDKSGDWQHNGTPVRPNAVFGSWKGAVLTQDNTKAGSPITIAPGANPAKNHFNLGGGTPFPTTPADEGYSAEVVWNLANLGLTPNHAYRLQFMVHDGDQNKTGGDVGEACINVLAH
ncbi:MAG: hypothetical protein ACRD3J_12145, partial [Thermoanaerobaculia bacterium]